MADITIKKKTGISTTEPLYPTTTWTQVENKPTTFTPTAHTHTKSDITDFAHTHVATDITDLKSALKYLYIYGKAQSAITKGQAVQFAGVQGDHILMKPAVPSEINANPDYFIGLAESTLATNDFGYILTQGELVNVDTSTYTAGNILWFASGGSTAGALTATEPTGLNSRIQVASVNKVNATEGILFVRVNFVGTEIEDIVASGTPSETTYLRGDGSWATVSGGGGGDFLPLTGGTLTGSLGVGGDPVTTSGYVFLTVGKNEANKVGILKFRSTYNSGNGSEIYQDTSGKTWLNVNGSVNAMVYDTSGNVGIGTTSPASGSKLTIRDASIANARFENTVGGFLEVGATLNASSEGFIKYTNALRVFEGSNERLSLVGSNVGIGVNDPQQKLDVDGNIRLINGANRFIRLGSVSNYGYDVGSDGDNFFIKDIENRTRLYITYPNGNVGIGTTSPDNQLTISQVLQFNDALDGDTTGKFAAYSYDNKFEINPRTTTGASAGVVGLAMNTSGNIGLGTLSPSQKLDVNGNINLGGTSNIIKDNGSNRTTANFVLSGTELTITVS
jgi:hypothetical protein